MKTKLTLITHLASLDEEQLSELIRRRFEKAPPGVIDFFDLSEKLLSQANIRRALQQLNPETLERVVEAGEFNTAYFNVASHELLKLALATGDNDTLLIPEEVAKEAKKFLKTSPLLKESEAVVLPEANIFEAVQNSFLILNELTSFWDEKENRIRLRRNEITDIVTRTKVPEAVVQTLGAAFLQKSLPGLPWKMFNTHADLLLLLAVYMPYSSSASNELHLAQKYLGLFEGGPLAKVLPLIAEADLLSARAEITVQLPELKNIIFVGPDFRIIAPGPVSLDLLNSLIELAEPITIGLASSFAITQESINLARSRGWSGAQILTLLERFQISEIAQPLRFMLTEIDNAENSVDILPDSLNPSRSIIKTPNTLFLEQLVVDQKLKMLGLRRSLTDANSAVLQLSAGYAKHILQEAGYSVSSTAKEKTIPEKIVVDKPNLIAELQKHLADSNQATAWPRDLAIKLLDAHTRENFSEKLKILEVAKRSRSRVTLEVRLGDNLVSINSTPISTQNGRVRVKDVETELERVFPVTSIESISISH